MSFYWNPRYLEILEWEPKSGWNPIFSQADRIRCARLYWHYKDTNGIPSDRAEILSQIEIYKQKYKGIQYPHN